MRSSLVLAIAGALFVVTGIGFLERSWGWTSLLAVFGALMIAVAAFRLFRGTKNHSTLVGNDR